MEFNFLNTIIDKKDPSRENYKVIKTIPTWLKDTPKLTTYRINLLKSHPEKVIEVIKQHLKEQLNFNKKTAIPNIYQIFPDTIGIESWTNENNQAPTDLNTNQEIPEVIVDAACGGAVLRGAHVFAPGVMGLSPNVLLNGEVNIYADVNGRCKRGLKIVFSDIDKYFVGTGRLKMSRNELFKENKPSGIAVETLMPTSNVPVIDSDLFLPGECLLQNLPSIICSKVLNPRSGETILDMCAAPGNKTSHIAELMKNKGTIIAIDKTESKLNILKKRCEEHSIDCVKTFVFDSTKAVSPDIDCSTHSILDGPPFPSETFDKVLLDAPCSALGKRPMLKYAFSVKMIESHSPLQRKLFHSAVKLLKKKGRLVYSTCTLTQAECESIVVWALKTFPDISLIPAEPLLGSPGWETSGLTEKQRCMLQRFGPKKDGTCEDNIYNDSVGFFIACFQKE
ncbi:tRNA (cytosine(72)-C(5))-methyltransferase NSUN6 [Arctopsyche grandis]|uniref:tRNA (cytosine(72)-C(5))-methyltransferase NSUN6 n=1 Tax=Arctopsyche grandis TaxID=121162 RepID=UPI00406D7AA8